MCLSSTRNHCKSSRGYHVESGARAECVNSGDITAYYWLMIEIKIAPRLSRCIPDIELALSTSFLDEYRNAVIKFVLHAHACFACLKTCYFTSLERSHALSTLEWALQSRIPCRKTLRPGWNHSVQGTLKRRQAIKKKKKWWYWHYACIAYLLLSY